MHKTRHEWVENSYSCPFHVVGKQVRKDWYI